MSFSSHASSDGKQNQSGGGDAGTWLKGVGPVVIDADEGSESALIDVRRSDKQNKIIIIGDRTGIFSVLHCRMNIGHFKNIQ